MVLFFFLDYASVEKKCSIPEAQKIIISQTNAVHNLMPLKIISLQKEAICHITPGTFHLLISVSFKIVFQILQSKLYFSLAYTWSSLKSHLGEISTCSANDSKWNADYLSFVHKHILIKYVSKMYCNPSTLSLIFA